MMQFHNGAVCISRCKMVHGGIMMHGDATWRQFVQSGSWWSNVVRDDAMWCVMVQCGA